MQRARDSAGVTLSYPPSTTFSQSLPTSVSIHRSDSITASQSSTKLQQLESWLIGKGKINVLSAIDFPLVPTGSGGMLENNCVKVIRYVGMCNLL